MGSVHASAAFVTAVRGATMGPARVLEGVDHLEQYAADALGIGAPPDLVVLPTTTEEISAVVRLCHEHRVCAEGAGIA